MKDNIDVLRYFCVVIYCLCQVNEVNGGDTVFVRCVCVSVCVSVRSGPVNQKGLKRLKLRTSNLTCMFPGTVDTSLGGDMHSHERLLVLRSNYKKTR